jgi:hypothetical protein
VRPTRTRACGGLFESSHPPTCQSSPGAARRSPSTKTLPVGSRRRPHRWPSHVKGVGCSPPGCFVNDTATPQVGLAEAPSAEDKAQDDQDDDNHDDQPEQATHRSLLSASQHDALLKIVVESVSRIHPRPRHVFPENDVREMRQLPAAWRGRKEVYHPV